MKRSADALVPSHQLTTGGKQKGGGTGRRWALAVTLWIVGVMIFGTICIVIHTHPLPWPIELSATKAIQGPHAVPCISPQQSQSWIGGISHIIDTLNGPIFSVLLPLLWVIVLLLLRWRRQAIFFGMAMLSEAGLWFGLQLLVGRPRPVTTEGICVQRMIPVHSFPSGHVIHDVVLYGFLLYLSFSQPVRKWRYHWIVLPLQVLAVFYLLAVGYSRLELGEHWLFDVLGAYLVAILWLSLIIFLSRWTTAVVATRHTKREKNKPQSPRRTMAIISTSRPFHARLGGQGT